MLMSVLVVIINVNTPARIQLEVTFAPVDLGLL